MQDNALHSGKKNILFKYIVNRDVLHVSRYPINYFILLKESN